MTSNRLEQELLDFDFSLCHPVKDSLFKKLMDIHRRENTLGPQKWAGSQLTDSELDLAVAAGNPASQAPHPFNEETRKI